MDVDGAQEHGACCERGHRSALLALTRRPRTARALVLVPPLLVGLYASGLVRLMCPLMGATGCRCPGCGLTRGAAFVARGDLGGAFAFHPFALAAVVGWVVLALWLFAGQARRGILERAFGRIERKVPVSTLLLAGFLVFGLVRLAVDAYGAIGTS
ncbi:MAG: DUF2752 domain-containing protein [Planctomycetota bacterium]|nr:DUF2752 domain-containing protein [Planctomycetota bacterium]